MVKLMALLWVPQWINKARLKEGTKSTKKDTKSVEDDNKQIYDIKGHGSQI